MGFSTTIQGKTAHEAFIANHDAEIRLLENIKRCLTNKVKCDKEYASALSSVATQGQKLEKCEELSESVVLSVWKQLCSEWEARARRLRRGAEALETRALERLGALSAEGRRARKAVVEDQTRVAQNFTQLSEDVSRKQAEYQKHLEVYKQMRSKCEESYIKSPIGRGGRKLEEMRDKYQKVLRKLHLTHNEYVLLLAAAAECERDLRVVQLPAAVARQRAAQNAFIASWRTFLLEVAQSTDITTDQCIETQKAIETTIQNIKPQDEYKDFSDKITIPQTEMATFTFDPSLVENTSGKLQANQLTVDNLTVEWLKNKLQELETSIQENKDKQTSLQGPEIITSNGTLKNGNGGSPKNGVRVNGSSPEPISNRNSPTPDTPTTECARELVELRCTEKQWVRQAELLRQALNDLGCEEAPAACPEPATPPHVTPPRSPANNDRQGDGSSIASTASYAIRRHLASVLPQRKLFKALGRPFRRKSAPCSPVPSIKLRTQRGGSEGPSTLVNLSVKQKKRAIKKKRFQNIRKPNLALAKRAISENAIGVFVPRRRKMNGSVLSLSNSSDDDSNRSVVSCQLMRMPHRLTLPP